MERYKEHRDILLFVSDQHTAAVSGLYGNRLVKTPNLDRLGAAGVCFDAAYTPCPLCVPARASLMTGKLPQALQVYNNSDSLGSAVPTMAHSLAACGYETVLIGRMHFVGPDQSHGFESRICGDFSPAIWGRDGINRKDLKSLAGTTAEKYCLTKVGAMENQPVLEYDNAVTQAALDYLAKPHDRPQFIVVGLYSPHFPYLAPMDALQRYRALIPITDKLTSKTEDPAVAHKRQAAEPTLRRDVLAAYYALTEELDRNLGRVMRGWNEYLTLQGHRGCFCYLSDHGDMLGAHSLYGKKCFYENAVRVPLVFAGDGILKGHRISGAISLCDIAPTLCAYGNSAPLPAADGISLLEALEHGTDDIDRLVLSELMLDCGDEVIPMRMVKQGDYKLMVRQGYSDLLFNTHEDPEETTDISATQPNMCRALREYAMADWRMQDNITSFQTRRKELMILSQWGKDCRFEESSRFHFSQEDQT